MNTDIIFSASQVNGRTRGRRRFRLTDISFALPAGYIMGLIGKNGAGKTTFFDYIMNESRRYAGEMCLDGRDIHDDHLWTLDQIGFVSEKNEFMELRTAEQNAQLLGRFYSDFDMALFEEMLEQMEISGKKTLGKMSRGELMKFQLAFAAAHRPKLYLMDEATAGMDPVFRIDFYRLLRRFIQDESCSVILSTHLEEEIEKQLDYVGMLESGRFISFRENTPERGGVQG